MNYKQFCEKQAETLLAIINNASTELNWRKPWKNSIVSECGLPFSTNGYYSGINLLVLSLEQSRKDYTSSQWLTFNQIKKLGYSVNKGEKGTSVIFWSPIEKLNKETGKKEKSVIMRNYIVFNLHQTNMEKPVIEKMKCDFLASFKPLNLSNFNVVVNHGGNRAFYRPSTDSITMPPKTAFNNESDYLAVFLHELTHWTAHKDRLPRSYADNYSFDKKARATEELIAELGSLFLCAHFGINSDVENHASYVQSWQKYCGKDEVTEAIKIATKAFKFILDIANTEHLALAS